MASGRRVQALQGTWWIHLRVLRVSVSSRNCKSGGARPSAIGSHGTGKSARFLREAGDDEACPGYRCRVHGLHRFALALLCRRSAPRWSSIPCDGLHWARRIDCALSDVPCTIVFPRRPASQYPKRVLREDFHESHQETGEREPKWVLSVILP